jgi:hypothetical protein
MTFEVFGKYPIEVA